MAVLITGASKGIGKSTARVLAKRGYDLLVTYRSDRRGIEELAEEVERLGVRYVVSQLDVRNKSDIEKVKKTFLEKFGKGGLLINNAGVVTWKKFGEQREEEIEMQIDVNFKGVVMMCKYFLDIVDTIINIASGAGKSPYALLSVYCGTKFGVRGFTKSLALEYPEKKIVVVNPGMTATQMTGFRGVDPEVVANIIADVLEGKIDPIDYEVDVWNYY